MARNALKVLKIEILSKIFAFQKSGRCAKDLETLAKGEVHSRRNEGVNHGMIDEALHALQIRG